MQDAQPPTINTTQCNNISIFIDFLQHLASKTTFLQYICKVSHNLFVFCCILREIVHLMYNF
jgi:hypothetical protein